MPHAARLLSTMAAVLLTGAAVAVVLPSCTATEPPISIEPIAVDLRAVPTGPYTLTFTIANPAGRPRRVIGLAEG